MTRTRRLLVPRAADEANFNPQAKNAQRILATWRSPELRPTILAFREPDPAVAGNALVDLLRIAPDRFWTARLVAAYLGPFDAVFSPGAHHTADWLGLAARRMLGQGVAIIDTVEGLLAPAGDDHRERLLTEFAGHQVFCQKIAPQHFRRVDSITQSACHIIAISPFLGRMARRLYGDRVSVLPLGVDLTVFRRGGGPARERLRVVGAGGVHPHKRPEIFVQLAQNCPDADFVWFGDGSKRAELIAEVARLGLPNLTFPGAVDTATLGLEFGASDVFVLPSLAEGVPKVTQEAAAAGLAQIIFGFYEAPTVADGRNGFVVWNDDELLCKLQEMLNHRDLVVKMGQAGEEMARNWSWEAVAPRWEKQICQVLNTK